MTKKNLEPYKIRLSGNIQNILLVGAIYYVKNRSLLRFVVTIIGITFLVLGIFAHFVYFFTGQRTLLITSGFFLLFVSILAGENFNVYIGEPQEVIERQEAEQREKTSPTDPYIALELATKRVNEYYVINQSQARGSFRWAIFVMLCGFTTIISGVWLFYLYPSEQSTAQPNLVLTSLSTLAGIVINVISVLYIRLHNRTQRRAIYYYNQLVRLQELGLLIRLADTYETTEAKQSVKDKILTQTLELIKISAELDSREIYKETL